MPVEKIIAKTFVFVIILIIALFGIGVGNIAQAQCDCDPASPTFGTTPAGRPCICNPLRYDTIQEIIDAIVNVLWYLSWILVPLLIVIGAFYIVTAGGSEKRVSTGKKIILYAVLGFMLVLFVRGIIGLVYGILGVT